PLIASLCLRPGRERGQAQGKRKSFHQRPPTPTHARTRTPLFACARRSLNPANQAMSPPGWTARRVESKRHVDSSNCAAGPDTSPRVGTGMTIRQHRGDLPDLARYTGAVAIDTETMGLDLHRDRLCVVQLSPGDGSADVVQIPPGARDAPHIKAL